MSVPDIEVTGVDSVMETTYGDEIAIKPEVSQEGRTEDDFEYLWEIDLNPGKEKERIELGTDPELSYKVSNTPSDTPYTLSLKVTDKQTGLARIVISKIYVSNSLGEGLLVAYTRDRGQTSELDLVSSNVLTYGYTASGPKYTREIYSLANGAPVKGRINAMSEIVDSDNEALNENKTIIGTDNHIIALDPLTFKEKASDGELFNNSKEAVFNTTAVFNFAAYVTGAIINGNMYAIVCIIDKTYSKLTFTQVPEDIFTPCDIAYAKLDQGKLVVFNKNDGKFYYIPGWQAMSGAFSEVANSFDFNLKGATSIMGGCSKNSCPAFLIKDASGAYHICIMDLSGNSPVLTHYTLDGEGLGDLVSVAFCDNADLMYYATPTKIYSVILSGGKATTQTLSWTPDSSDEKITGIMQYCQGWYGTHQYGLSDYDFPLKYNRLQLMITTYNEKTGEGKIYLRPFNVSTGLFTYKDNGTLSGFGEITAITSTLK